MMAQLVDDFHELLLKSFLSDTVQLGQGLNRALLAAHAQHLSEQDLFIIR